MNNKAMFYFDCETSGLDCKHHGILQIAWIIEKNGEILSQACHDVCIGEDKDINLQALQVNGFTLERIKNGMHESVLRARLYEHIKLAVGGGEGLIPCGHNVRFDLDFLNALIQKGDEKYSLHYGNGSMLYLNRPVCTLALCHYLNARGVIKLDNFKLATVCGFFGIPLKAHDALADITATRELLVKINAIIKEKIC